MFIELSKKISNISLELAHFMSNIDIENINCRLTSKAINEHRDIIKKLNTQNIFMPLMYMVMNDVFDVENIEEFISNRDIKDFYIERIREIWLLRECEVEENLLKKEIIDNLNQNNRYSTYILLMTLFEGYINKKYGESFKNKRYEKIKNKLKIDVFNALSIPDYFDKFIESDIYSKSDYGGGYIKT